MTIKRYVFDTNVLVSAVIYPNSIAKIAYNKALDLGVFLASCKTMLEYEKVFLRPKFNRYVSLENRLTFLHSLRLATEFVTITEFIQDCRDSKDNMYLEVAINGEADLIITGDKDLLELHLYRNYLPIITPSNFVNLV